VSEWSLLQRANPENKKGAKANVFIRLTLPSRDQLLANSSSSATQSKILLSRDFLLMSIRAKCNLGEKAKTNKKERSDLVLV
jgi:hypothetical protein